MEKENKRGRPKAFDSPDKMLEYFEAYVKETKSNPFLVQDFVGKDGNEVNRTKEKCLTLEGFEIYCFFKGIINDLGDYFKNKDERYTDFAPICHAIKKRIRQDQILGGMSGIYNPSITQRLNGLVEKQSNENSGEISVTVKYAKRDSDNT